MPESIKSIAKTILAQEPCAVVRHRLLRDVLKRPTDEAKAALDRSTMVQMLAEEQCEDGSWGRFHSMDTTRKQKIKTTEAGVRRAIALGLDKDHPICANACDYLVRILKGQQAFPDRPEPNDRWPVGERLFLTATLSLLEPEHPLVQANRAVWIEILKRTFHDGCYDQDAEVEAHCELTGATTMPGFYLTINNRYALELLSSGTNEVPAELERTYLNWLTTYPDGINYIGRCRINQPPTEHPSSINCWFQSWEVLSHFPHWVEFAQPSIDWLWSQQNDNGLWDFGSRPARYGSLPLSDSWRKKNNRIFDWSTRVLLLLSQYERDS